MYSAISNTSQRTAHTRLHCILPRLPRHAGRLAAPRLPQPSLTHSLTPRRQHRHGHATAPTLRSSGGIYLRQRTERARMLGGCRRTGRRRSRPAPPAALPRRSAAVPARGGRGPAPPRGARLHNNSDPRPAPRLYPFRRPRGPGILRLLPAAAPQQGGSALRRGAGHRPPGLPPRRRRRRRFVPPRAALPHRGGGGGCFSSSFSSAAAAARPGPHGGRRSRSAGAAGRPRAPARGARGRGHAARSRSRRLSASAAAAAPPPSRPARRPPPAIARAAGGGARLVGAEGGRVRGSRGRLRGGVRAGLSRPAVALPGGAASACVPGLPRRRRLGGVR